jgi:hypothetical protein
MINHPSKIKNRDSIYKHNYLSGVWEIDCCDVLKMKKIHVWSDRRFIHSLSLFTLPVHLLSQRLTSQSSLSMPVTRFTVWRAWDASSPSVPWNVFKLLFHAVRLIWSRSHLISSQIKCPCPPPAAFSLYFPLTYVTTRYCTLCNRKVCAAMIADQEPLLSILR